jgi:hypothetical protein
MKTNEHRPLPPIKYLKRRLRLDVLTGHLYWRSRPASDFSAPKYAMTWNKKHAGKRAGAERGLGYRVVIVDKTRYYEHRVAFALSTGRDPAGFTVDHACPTKTNAPQHLRIATNQENVMRRHRLGRNNTSGVLGVWWHAGADKWSAQIKFCGKKVHLGLYQDLAGAAEARKQAEAFFFGAFAPTILNEHG